MASMSPEHSSALARLQAARRTSTTSAGNNGRPGYLIHELRKVLRALDATLAPAVRGVPMHRLEALTAGFFA